MKNNIKFLYKICLCIFVFLICYGFLNEKNKVYAGAKLPDAVINIKIENIEEKDTVKALSKGRIINLRSNIQGIYTLGYGYDGEEEFFTILIYKENEIIQSDILSATYKSEANNDTIDAYFDANTGKHISKFVFLLKRFFKNDYVKFSICIVIYNILLLIVLKRFKCKRKIILYIINIGIQVVFCFPIFVLEIGIKGLLLTLLNRDFVFSLFFALLLFWPMITLDIIQYFIFKRYNTDIKTSYIIKFILISNIMIILTTLFLPANSF